MTETSSDDFTTEYFWLRLEVSIEFVRDGQGDGCLTPSTPPSCRTTCSRTGNRWAMVQYALAVC